MPAPVGEDYVFQLITPKTGSELYLTSNGEGKQLTVEKQNLNQQWTIQTLPGEKIDSPFRIIIPAFSKDIPAVSQDVVEFPEKVSLIKNLQVWTFISVSEKEPLYEIESNLYAGVTDMVPLLGVDKDSNVIIQKISLFGAPPPPPRPVWNVIPVLKKE